MAPATKSATVSKLERVYRELLDGIVSGRYSPGYRLVLDRIARDMKVSAVPVREAVRRLEAEGLVTFQRNVGAIVSGIDASDYAASMETCAVLEGYATALAAPHLTEEDLDEAQEVTDKMRALLNHLFDPREFSALNQQFHRILVGRCPNERLVEAVEKEWVRITLIRRAAFAFDPKHSTRSVDEHDGIIAAIRDGKSAELVEKLAREHKMRTRQQYLDMQKEKESGQAA